MVFPIQVHGHITYRLQRQPWPLGVVCLIATEGPKRPGPDQPIHQPRAGWGHLTPENLAEWNNLLLAPMKGAVLGPSTLAGHTHG